MRKNGFGESPDAKTNLGINVAEGLTKLEALLFHGYR
jgi:hypothetical protein